MKNGTETEPTTPADEPEIFFDYRQYRNPDGSEYGQVTASCKCGRGGFIRVPKHAAPTEPEQRIRVCPGLGQIHSDGSRSCNYCDTAIAEKPHDIFGNGEQLGYAPTNAGEYPPTEKPEHQELEQVLVSYGRFMQRHSPEAAEAVTQAYREALAAINAHYKQKFDHAIKPLPGLNKATAYARWYGDTKGGTK